MNTKDKNIDSFNYLNVNMDDFELNGLMLIYIMLQQMRDEQRLSPKDFEAIEEVIFNFKSYIGQKVYEHKLQVIELQNQLDALKQRIENAVLEIDRFKLKE